MPTVVVDNDVIGIADRLEATMRSSEWNEFAEAIGVEFVSLEDVGLQASSPDTEVWHRCQELEAVLITANRSGGEDSLQETIQTTSDQFCTPVVTISNAQRVDHDPDYLERAVVGLLDILERLDNLRGTQRLYIP